MSVKFEEQCFAFIITEEPHVFCRFMMVLAVLSFLLSQLATNTICIIPSATALRPPSALMDAGASCLQIPIDLVWESIGDVSVSCSGFQIGLTSDGRVLAAGVPCYCALDLECHLFSATDVFDPVTITWSAIGDYLT